ncbi:MAG: hypothetical protein D6795_14200 [Deltaproteobacteria bacterium]|nr:MAG: hypothetical protein D6795_14200 [Deltaproteobacteria bacterium]
MLLLPLLLASPAGAQGKKEKKSKGQPATVYQFSAIEIQGQVQRPSAIYFLQRAKIEYYGEVGVRRSFIPEIIESVIDEALLTTKNRIPRSLIRSYEE